MSNKYLNFLAFSMFLIVSGMVYQKYYRPAEIGSCDKVREVVEVNMKSLENQWKFDPDILYIKKCDHVILHIYNEDIYDHGFAIEAFGVNNRLFPKRTTKIEFDASNIGEYKFYCSVACGEGHYQQTGKIIVEE